LGYQPRIRLKFEVNCPYDHSNHEREHDPVDHDGVLNFSQHSPEHQHQRERKHHHVEAGNEVGPGAGVFEGMGRVGAKETTAIGSDLLDWNNRPDRTDYQGLLFCGALVIGSHCTRFHRRSLDSAFESHRHALLKKQPPGEKCRWQKHVDEAPPHIEEEVSYFSLPSKCTDYCGQCAETDSSG